MTTPMIQRMAEAMARELARQDYDDPWFLSPDLKVAYLDQGEVDFGLVARAALGAMAEPTDRMAEAWSDAEEYQDHPAEHHLNPRRWKAAIQAALHETKDAVGREGE